MFRPSALVLLSSCLAHLGCSTPAAEPANERPVAKLSADGVVELPEAQRKYLTVAVATAQKGGATLAVPAHVAFKDGAQSQLGAPLSGRVLAVQVRTGDTVKAGDSLVTLDCPDAATVRTALATAAAAQREALVASQREKAMLAQGVGVEREVLAAETKLAEAEAELARARAGSAFVGAGSGTTVTLRAPIGGTVIARKAMVGSAVQAGGDPLVEIGDPNALWVVADVPERDLSLVREGARATVELPSLHDPVVGRVASVGAVVANGARSAPVRIELEGGGKGTRPGMFGRAHLESASEGLALPTEAVLIRDGKDTVVYVEETPARFSRRPVVVAQPVDGTVQVLSGLDEGERVVVKGALLLDGAADQLL